LDLHYKIDTGSDHVAKFHGDRPRDLGDYALKKRKKNITSKIEDLTYCRTGGRPNNSLFANESDRYDVDILRFLSVGVEDVHLPYVLSYNDTQRD